MAHLAEMSLTTEKSNLYAGKLKKSDVREIACYKYFEKKSILISMSLGGDGKQIRCLE